MITIGVLEDHPSSRLGLIAILENQLAFEVKCEVGSAAELFNYLDDGSLDILLLDLHLPDISGFDVLKKMKLVYPKIKIIVLSSSDDRHTISRVLFYGATGYLSKLCKPSEINDAIYAASVGRRYIGKAYRKTLEKVDILDFEHKEITNREMEVLRFVCRGYNTQEIADEISRSVHTINNHRASIMKKTNSKNLVNLITYASSHGLLD